jgi:Tol biopolymer transport system component
MEIRSIKSLYGFAATLVLAAMTALPLSATASTASMAAGDIERVSVSSGGEQGTGYSRSADVSVDGRFVVFRSDAGNLVAGDTNADEDIFLRDRQTGETTRLSLSSSGAQADGGSYYPSISNDGRYIAFNSDAANLVNGDTNGFVDIFVRDRQTGTTTRVSVSSGGQQANDNSDSYTAISGDGRYVAFNSDATNLVNGDGNVVSDIFVHDRQTGITERVSLNSDEVPGNAVSNDPAISADGRFVSFTSWADNLVAGDTNNAIDIFVRDRLLGVTTRVSVNSSGVQADKAASQSAISGDGRYVVFSSDATNMLDEEAYGYPHVYVHDRQTGKTTLASIDMAGYQMVGWSEVPDISADGRYIAFEFDDRGDGLPYRAIYMHDRLTGETTRVSGSVLDDSSLNPSISEDGHFVAFTSFSTRLISGDTNGVPDIYLREMVPAAAAITTYESAGAYDGWVLETGENDGTGGRIDTGATTFFLGDSSSDQQYRSILHFDTASLPNNAVIAKATLKIRKQGISGTNPFTTHGSLFVDVRNPYFYTLADLQPQDFQAASNLDAAGQVPYTPAAVWYTAALDPPIFSLNGLTGPTQFRLRFALDDNDDNGQDLIKFYSGDAAASYRPVLVIEYYPTTAGSPSVLGVLRADPDPTSASNVRFTVAFSEPVTGVDVTDFSLAATGLSGAAISSLTGSGDTYTVTVGTGTGTGTIRLDVVDDDSILDVNNNPLGRDGSGNGSFAGGQVYTVTQPSSFADVPVNHPYFEDIEIMYANGLTAGCSTSPLKYCPDQVMNRGEAAVFILRGNYGTGFVPGPPAHFFKDPA